MVLPMQRQHAAEPLTVVARPMPVAAHLMVAGNTTSHSRIWQRVDLRSGGAQPLRRFLLLKRSILPLLLWQS